MASINSIYDLLVEIIEKFDKDFEELESGLGTKITHGTTLGDVYEGLTKEVVEKTIFQQFNVKIVDGFIQGGSGRLSRQIDCMIVVGEGVQIPRTKHYVYDGKQVVAVVEVKKTLDLKELRNTIRNFAELDNLYNGGTFDLSGRFGPLHDHASFMAFEGERYLTKKHLTDPQNATEMEKYIKILISNDVLNPLKIIFGHSGYTTEAGLARGFQKVARQLLDEFPDGDFALANALPHLTISGDVALVKNNGMPEGGYQRSTEIWDLISSTPFHGLYHFIDQIWFRLLKLTGRRSYEFFTDGRKGRKQSVIQCKTNEELKFVMNLPRILNREFDTERIEVGRELRELTPLQSAIQWFYYDSDEARHKGIPLDDKNWFLSGIIYQCETIANFGIGDVHGTLVLERELDFDEVLIHLLETELFYVDKNRIFTTITVATMLLKEGRMWIDVER